jgi:hypothetical protein
VRCTGSAQLELLVERYELEPFESPREERDDDEH